MAAAFTQLQQQASRRWQALQARPWIRVGTGLLGNAAGAQGTVDALRRTVQERGLDVTISEVGPWGLCFAEPMVDIYSPDGLRVLYSNIQPHQVAELVESHLVNGQPKVDWALATMDSEVPGIPRWEELPVVRLQTRIALRNAGHIDPVDVLQYVARGGFEAMDKALFSMTPEDVLQEVKDSGLRGRGGAAFPTGTKLGFLAASKPSKKFILCNGEEGDPGAFNDKAILEADPFTLIEGAILAGYATNATNGIVFIRHGHWEPIERARRAIQACYDHGLLGQDILGSGFSFHMEVALVGESYVAGEETALMEAVEGKRSMPRFRPPFPAAVGAWGHPSNINNIKTLSYIPEIVRRGAGWFAGIGTPKSTGTAIVCLSGHVKLPGFVEVPFGVTMRQVVEELGGGASDGKAVKLVQTGGPLGGVLPASLLDITLDFDLMAQAEAMFGSGGIIVANEDTSVVDLTRVLIAFDQLESCGKCFPCRLGMSHLLEILDRACDGAARPGDLELMDRIGANMRAGSLCGHGQLGYNPVKSALKSFGDEFQAQANGGGPLPGGRFVAPTSTVRGAQFDGKTPTAQVYPQFVVNRRGAPERRAVDDDRTGL